MSSAGTPVEILSRDERVARFGLDCGNALEWRSWEPGGEYVKNLVIKNVATQTQKIKYKLPQTKFFGMSFPETITLSAGMSFSFKVTFRPIELNRYDDYIAFTCNGGSFNVPIRATLPSVGVVFTPKDCVLDFGVGSVNEPQTQKLSILNTGEVPFNYSLILPDADLPFKVTPLQGTLAPQETATLTLSFLPREASSYVVQAMCSISGIQRPINLRAISKYSFIVTDTTLLAFGDVLVGRNVERVLNVKNLSLVKTSMKIRRVESDCDPAFTFSNTSARIGPGDTASFKITYTAATSGLYSSDTYELLTPGGNTVTVRCSGNAVGPFLVPSATAFNFGSITLGSTARRVLALTNQSDTPSFFQFFTPDASDGACSPAFIIEPLQGTVPPRGNVTVAFTFTPSTPIAFYKRLICLVRSGIPIYVDLVATAFDDTTRPAPLMQRHVDRFYARRIRANGLTSYPPETIEAIELPEEERIKDEELEVTGEMAREIAATDPWEVFFYQNTHFSNTDIDDSSKVGLGLYGVKEVEVMESFVDFGACPKFPTTSKTTNVPKVEPKIIRVANRTNGKVTCVWSVPKSAEQSIFRVEPPVEDIAPHSIQYFRIHFQPRAANQFYGARLECYAYYKTMRNFRLVVEKSITPPWCFFTNVAGHTYEQGSETFLPRVELGSSKIGFTSCHVGGATHQIVSISNTGDTSLSYKFDFPNGSVFSCHPARGVLRQERTHLIVFRFRPTSLMTFRQLARCVLNNSASNSIPISLVGTASIASVSFPELVDDFEPLLSEVATKSAIGNGTDDAEPSSAPLSKDPSRDSSVNSSTLPSTVATPHNTSPPPSTSATRTGSTGSPPSSLYFRLTCIGTITRRTFVVRNPSRIPVSFQVAIPEKYREIFYVEPAEGEMLGNETTTLCCSFAPAKAKRYTMKVAFSVCAKSTTAKSEVRSIPLTVVGEGVIGRLELDSRRIDFGNVLIGAATKREVVIRNATPCDVQYSLEWRLPNGQLPDSAAVFGPSEVWDLADDGSDSEEGDDAMTDVMTNDGNIPDAQPGTPATFRIKKFPVLEIVPASGFIPAYSTTTASIIIRPRGPALLTYKIVSNTLISLRLSSLTIPRYVYYSTK